MALTVAKTCTKVGLSGVAVYWSIQEGIWGTTREGSAAMKRLSATVLPQETQALVAPPPEVKKLNDSLILNGWNKGTKAVFECIRDVPEYAGQAKTAASKFVEDTFSK